MKRYSSPHRDQGFGRNSAAHPKNFVRPMRGGWRL